MKKVDFIVYFQRLTALVLLVVALGAGSARAQWTDSNTGVTFEFVSGTAGNTDEGPAKAIDGNTGTKFCTSTIPAELVLQASQPINLTGYTITTANDNASCTNRNPLSWTIEGSNDNSSWTTLVTVTDDQVLQDVNYTQFDFTCSTTGYYTYFRFTVTAHRDGWAYQCMQYSEFHPLGTLQPIALPCSTQGATQAATDNSSNAGYVFCYGGTNFMGGSSTTNITTFNPSTCLWTVSSNLWLNSAGYYLYNVNNGSAASGTDGVVTVQTTNTDRTWTLNGTESGTTGKRITRNSRYLYFNSSNQWMSTTSTSSARRNIVFAVTKHVYSEAYTNPAFTVSSNTISTTGASAATCTRTTNASYTRGYIDYVFRNGAHHYFELDNSTSISSAPASESVTYTWGLEGIDAQYATINSSTGVISYLQLVPTDQQATVTLAAVSASRTVKVCHTVTFEAPRVDPTGISATSPMTVYVGRTGQIIYTLTPANCYNNVSYQSANTGIATVNNGTVTGVAIGTTTITLTANKANGASGAPTTTVTVNVRDVVATPAISFSGTGATATCSITCATSPCTIHYTVNGGAEQTYSAPFTVSSNDVVRAYATTSNSSYDPSDWAESTYSIASGVSGGVVTLNDLEDHRWTYYAGVPSAVDGGNYNTSYLGTLYSPNPRNVKITYRGNGGAVSISEPETTFVYYKTLEQGSATGEYPYQVISNPFSKRPTGKGFGGWKVVSGGDYISGYSNNQTLPLDQDIVFTNLPYTDTNCISAEIVLEATWVNATIKYGASNVSSSDFSGGTYETNLLVLNASSSSTLTTSYPVTIMMVEPDGSADYRSSYAFTGNITPSNTGVTKVEFTKWNSSNTVNANFKNLWMGRGMTTTSQNANLLSGSTSTASTASPHYSLKVESGKLNYVSMIKGYMNTSRSAQNDTYTITGDNAQVEVTFGNDYDRAAGNNNNLEIINGTMMGCNGKFDPANRANTHTLNVVVKSGKIGTAFFMENTTNTYYLRGDAGNCMYLSNANKHTFVGRRSVTIEGGDLCTVGSGIDYWNNTTGTSTNPTPSTTTNYGYMSFEFRMKGGTIHGNVYGGAAKSPSGCNRRLVVTGGQVKGWLAAGCNGTDDDGGQNYGASYVYIGGNGRIDSEGSTKTLGYASGGNVYAAGAGKTGSTTCGEMTFGSSLVVADNCFIERGAYGGGNYGYTLSSSKIYITGGTNAGESGTVSSVATEGGIFGGANQQNGPEISIWMTGGVMQGGIYGGCNTTGTISGNVTMHIDGGQVGTDASHKANIHGGGLGSATVVTNNVDITLGRSGQAAGTGVVVYGDVYGGSALGTVNGTAATTDYHTNVTMNRGTVHGDIYGGGLGDATNAANVYGPVVVTIHGGEAERVFGCNNTNGSPQQNTNHVNMDGGQVGYIYGGGNAAPYTGTPYVHMTGGRVTNHVFGGGLGANATITGSTNVTIDGSAHVLKNVYGGGNAATVSGDTFVKIE